MPETKDLDLNIGLGDAIQRLIAVERRYSLQHTSTPQDLLDERDMIVAALNTFTVELGMYCNDVEGVPENVQVFEHAVITSCCRIRPTDTSRRTEKETPARSGFARVFDPILGIWTQKAKE